MAGRRPLSGGSCGGGLLIARRFGVWKDKRDGACYMQVRNSREALEPVPLHVLHLFANLLLNFFDESKSISAGIMSNFL